MFVLMMLFGPGRGPSWFDYSKPRTDPKAAWRAFAGWSLVRALGIAALGWVVIRYRVGAAAALEAVGLALAGWVIAAVMAAAFEASKPEE
jgi:Na+/proline symporter